MQVLLRASPLQAGGDAAVAGNVSAATTPPADAAQPVPGAAPDADEPQVLRAAAGSPLERRLWAHNRELGRGDAFDGWRRRVHQTSKSVVLDLTPRNEDGAAAATVTDPHEYYKAVAEAEAKEGQEE